MSAREPVKATCVPKDVLDSGIPGAYAFEANFRGLFYLCPCGCGDHGFIPFREAPDHHPSWEWNGDRDAPSLTPSIRRTAGCYFHGHLLAGVWTFEPDSGVRPEGTT